MKMNPVYKRETMVSARSFKLSLILLIFNGILALVALLNMYSTLAQVRLTAEIQYSSFLDLYVFVAVLEFVMLIFIMPALTAGSISGERERQTLELMLTTRMTPAEIVLGKMMASLSTMSLMIISSFPILAMVFVYGGVTLNDIVVLLLCYVAAALFVGSLGICCSAVFQKTTLSTVVSYGADGSGGAWDVRGEPVCGLYEPGPRRRLSGFGGQSAGTGNSGGFLYLLLMNPTSTFIATMMRLAGTGIDPADQAVTGWFGEREMNLVLGNWVECSVMIQLLLAMVFIWIAVKAISPGRK